MFKPIAIVIGFIGKLPMAGMSLYNVHYIIALQTLGYEVHYVEHQNSEYECYDPNTDTMTNDPSYAIDYLGSLLRQFSMTPEHYSFIDLDNRCYGSGWNILRGTLNHADFILTLCDPTWFDELERCPQRAFVDGDPLFTQVEISDGKGIKAEALKKYGILFTYGVRIGKKGCTIPTAGRKWIPTRPVVATELWKPTPAGFALPVTALMHWAAGGDVTYNAQVYGHKNKEFERFIQLPRIIKKPFDLAIGGPAPKERLRKYGWNLVNPLTTSKTIKSYKEFIGGSYADLGIAKHAYVASRSGWFSDRSTCYMAGGRPVLHQDTGCGDWLPTGEGVLLFSDIKDVLEALISLDKDYERHSRAARRIAEEHFEAAKVVGRMLDDAGFR